jgi:hypothetical protein
MRISTVHHPMGCPPGVPNSNETEKLIFGNSFMEVIERSFMVSTLLSFNVARSGNYRNASRVVTTIFN